MNDISASMVVPVSQSWPSIFISSFRGSSLHSNLRLLPVLLILSFVFSSLSSLLELEFSAFGRGYGEAMAKFGKSCFALLLVFLAVTTTASVNSPPEKSPSRAPASSPSESPMSSTPSHPPTDISPNPSPAESPSYPSQDSSPSPIPNKPSGITKGVGAEDTGGSKGGMSGGTKAGIAVGVIVGAVLAGVVGMTYKKRRDNIRRAENRYERRREIL